MREGGGELGDGPDAGRFDVVTRLVQLDNFPSATAVAALRPLVASFGYIEALPETNTLVVTDTVENVDRIEAIARSLDEGDGTQLSTIPVRNVDAAEIATALTRVLGAEGGLAMRVAIDARNNVLLVRGSPELTDRVRLMVADLDQPGRQPPALVPVTRVYRLRYADAASAGRGAARRHRRRRRGDRAERGRRVALRPRFGAGARDRQRLRCPAGGRRRGRRDPAQLRAPAGHLARRGGHHRSSRPSRSTPW